MGFWSDLRESIDEATAGLQTRIAQYKNRTFSNAAMATCALISAADGEISSDERQKTFKAIQKNTLLQVFEMRDLKEDFDVHCSDLEDDFDFGKMNCLGVIGKVKGKDDQSRDIVRLGIIIGGADGDFDDDEKAVVREICRTLGLSPTEFDL